MKYYEPEYAAIEWRERGNDMWRWLRTAAAIALVSQVISVQAAEIGLSREHPLLSLDNLVSSLISTGSGSYGSYGYDLANGVEPKLAVGGGLRIKGRLTPKVSPEPIPFDHIQFEQPSWLLNPVGVDPDQVEIHERTMGYDMGDPAIYRGIGTPVTLFQALDGLDTNWTGWKTHLGMTPTIATRLGIPTTLTQRGVRLGADYHF